MMPKSLIEMAAEIATAQASHTLMSPEEVAAFLKKTFLELQRINVVEESAVFMPGMAGGVGPEAMEPKRSIRKNKVICLECGREFSQLTRAHLKRHDLTAKEYRKKYGFSARQALSAKSLTARRRKTAKELGLGEKLIAARKAKLALKANAGANSTKGKKTKTAATEKATEKKALKTNAKVQSRANTSINATTTITTEKRQPIKADIKSKVIRIRKKAANAPLEV